MVTYRKKIKIKKIWKWVGLGRCWRTWGGGYVTTCWMHTQISQIKPIYDIIQVRRCNCKQQKRKRLKLHYIACNTDVSHINGNYTSYGTTKRHTTTRRRADACTSCVPQFTYNLPRHTTPPRVRTLHTPRHIHNATE